MDIRIFKLFYGTTQLAFFTYHDGNLWTIEGLIEAVKMAKKPLFSLPIPYKVQDMQQCIEEYQPKGFIYEEIQNDSTGKKIAHFCEAYKRAFDMSYKVEAKYAAKWTKDYGHIPNNVQALDFYMSSTKFPVNGPKSIQDYLSYYQQVLQLMAKDNEQKANPDKFPYTYDKDLYNSLSNDVPKFERYKTWLRSLGYKAIKNSANQTVWRKES